MSVTGDLNDYNINVTSGFKGHELTLFGSKEHMSDLAIIITGPERNYIVSKRYKIIGLWIGREIMLFNNLPSYYAFWASQDIAQNDDLSKFYNLGLNNILLENPIFLNEDLKVEEFKNAFIEMMNKRKGNYFGMNIINFPNNHLFKIKANIPHNVAMGNYFINVESFENGHLDTVVSMKFKITPLNLNKFLGNVNENYSKTYLLLLLISALLSTFMIKYIMKR